jgi:subtilisin-like proprotein convertase family protein
MSTTSPIRPRLTRPVHSALVLLAAAASLAAVAVPGPAHAATVSLSNAAPIAVPPGGTGAPDHSPGSPYPSSIAVSGVADVVTGVSVRLHGLTHQLARDVDVLLVGPGGQRAIVMSDVGGNGPVSNASPTFTDSATGPAPNDALGSGTYRPTDLTNGFNQDVWPAPAPTGPYGTAFSVFDGTNPNGTWSLYVVDDTNGDAGTIAGGWTLTLETGTATFPGQLQLRSAEVRGTEGGGVATVTVDRVGGDDGVVSLTVATGTGTATAGADYTPIQQQVSFADGQTTATVDVPIADDAAAEGIDELVPVVLSGPTGGATLGTPSSGQVRIQDNDARLNAFPIDAPRAGSVNAVGPAYPYPSNVVVTGAGGVVTDVDVTLLDVSHAHVRDLDVLLVAPNGATTLLVSDVGPSSPVADLDLTFSDEASAGISQTALAPGTYRPSRFDDGTAESFLAPAPAGPWGSELGALDGSSPNGTWSLYVVDDAGGDLGGIAGGWRLALQTATAGVGGPYTAPEGSPVTLGATTTPPLAGATYAWDVDGDGQYDDATGQTPTVDAVTLAALGLGDGPDTSNVRVRATSGGAVITSSATTLTITNVGPTATLRNDGPVVLGSPATVRFDDRADPSTVDSAAGLRHAYDLDDDGDWDLGDGTYAGGVTSPSATVPASVLDAPGSYDVVGRVIDKDGGSSDRTTTVLVETPPNSAPVADAGPDRDVDATDLVTLDGSGSSDADDDPLTFAWVQTGGPAVTLSSAATARPTFPAPAGPAVLSFELTVDDGQGGSDTDTVSVSVNGVPDADAGVDQDVDAGDRVMLDGSASADPDGDALAYGWVQTAGPAVTVEGATSSVASFTAPTGPATLVFRLDVADARSADSDTVTVRVNGVPDADAGVDQDVAGGDVVTLDARASSDPDGDGLSFAWVQTVGPPVQLTGAATARPTFAAPLSSGSIGFEVVVADGRGGSSTDTVVVRIDAERPTVDLVAAPADPVDGPFAVTLAFSEPVSGLTPDDLVVGNGAVTDLDGAGTTYTVLVSPASDGLVTLDLPAGAVSDGVGNPNRAAERLTRVADMTAPVLSLSPASGQPDPVRGDEVVVVVRADEPVGDLVPDAVRVLGGTGADAVSIARVDASTFSVTVTGMQRTGVVQVATVAGAVSDHAGNDSAVAVSPGVRWAAMRLPGITLAGEQRCVQRGAVVGLRLTGDDGSTLRATSSNAALLPPSRVLLRRAGSAVRLVLLPRGMASGRARITVTATNEAGSRRLVLGVAVGSAEPDRVAGGAGPDVLLARGRADRLRGGGGRDLLCGRRGDDLIVGGPGRDTLFGEEGDDVLVASRQDRVVGGPGRDEVRRVR